MRRCLYFLMVAVLIFRGLAGTAMAAGMLPPLAAAAHHAPVHTSHTHTEDAEAHHGGDATHLHEEHAANSAAETPCGGDCSDAAAAAHTQHSAACSACDICHSAMLDVAAAAMPVFSPVGSSPPAACIPFNSAPTALAVKPPIA